MISHAAINYQVVKIFNYLIHLLNIRTDAWEALHKFYCKISNIDPVHLITQDVVVRVTRHLEKIRLAQSNS